MLPVVTRLGAFRAHGHPLLLIAVWSILEAATIGWTALLPGDPLYSDSGIGSLGQALFVTSAAVLFLVLGSRIVWWLAIFSDTVGVGIGVALTVLQFGVKPIGLALFQAAALWLIWSGAIERYVRSGRRREARPARPVHD